MEKPTAQPENMVETMRDEELKEYFAALAQEKFKVWVEIVKRGLDKDYLPKEDVEA